MLEPQDDDLTDLGGPPLPRPAPRARATIALAQGDYFDLLDPETKTWGQGDIAHALANLCRFGGHTAAFYSVAQHSVSCSLIVPPDLAWQALWHDAAEAFIGDIPSPLKRLLPDYRALEARIEAAIRPALGLPAELHPAVRRADLILLATERRDLLPMHRGDGVEWACLAGIEPLSEISPIYPLAPHQARKWFVDRINQLVACGLAGAAP